MEYIWARPWEILQRLASTLWIACGIWLAWRERPKDGESKARHRPGGERIVKCSGLLKIGAEEPVLHLKGAG